MSAPINPADPPMAEPGKRPSGGDVGGALAAPDAGVADEIQRSTERAEAGAGTPPRSAPRAAGRGAVADASTRDADDEDEWRHPRVAPVDESNPLKSLGKAVGDTVTGSEIDAPARPKR
jgi:hypothetical protein